MNALYKLWAKLTQSKKYRHAFVASQLKRGIPTQIRVLRKKQGWTQEDLAKVSGLTQGAISRAEDPNYGNLTFNNVLKIAEGFDVAFVGKFVPFSELAQWYDNLSEETLQVPSFDEDSLTKKRITAEAPQVTESIFVPASDFDLMPSIQSPPFGVIGSTGNLGTGKEALKLLMSTKPKEENSADIRVAMELRP